MKDFKDQLNRAQSIADEGNSKRGSYYNKPAIAVVTAICLVILAMVIVMLVIFGKACNTAADVLLDDSNNSTYANNIYSGQYSGYSGNYQSNTAEQTEKTNAAPADFSYGVVAGTNYESSFSGLKFYGPSGWILQDHSALGSSSNGTLYDMAAQSSDGETSVAVLYYPLNSKYKSATAMLKAMQANTDGTVLNDSVSIRKGGNSFTGYIYTNNENGTTTYSEVIGTEVDGYVLLIQAKAMSSNELSAAIAYFR